MGGAWKPQQTLGRVTKMAGFLGPLSFGLQAVGAVVQTVGQIKEARASRRLARAGEARERTKQLREARIRRASIENAAVQQGVQGSSAEIGAISSISSQLGSNVAFGQTISRLNQQRANARTLAAIGGGISQLGGLASSANKEGLF